MSHGTPYDGPDKGRTLNHVVQLFTYFLYLFLVELHPDIFAANINQDHIHQTVKWQQTYKTGKNVK